MGYVKVWSSITESSVWSDPDETEEAHQRQKDVKILWVTMLAKADGTGFVEAAPSGLARLAALTREETEAALATLMAPDPESKSQVAEGRRVLKVDRGYFIVNHAIYRDRKDDESERTARREYMRSYRANAVKSDTFESVNGCNSMSEKVSQAEAEADPQAETEEEIPPTPQKGARRRRRQGELDLSAAQATRVLQALSEARRRVEPRARAMTPTASNLKLINDRLREGNSFADCLDVIRVCELECKSDPTAFRWFDAITPFRPENFARKLARAGLSGPIHRPEMPTRFGGFPPERPAHQHPDADELMKREQAEQRANAADPDEQERARRALREASWRDRR